MKLKENRLAVFSLFFALILVSGLLFEPFMLFLRGLTQTLVGGNSYSKVYFLFALFILSPLTAVLLQKKRLKWNAENFLKIFLIASAFSLILGMHQFLAFSSNYYNDGIFASFIQTENYANFESAGLFHNHFPKSAVYVLTQFLNLNLGEFDDGYPMYYLTENGFYWGAAYLLLFLASLISGLIYINLKSRKISLLNYGIFLFALGGTAIAMIDGGLATSTLLLSFFALSYFISEEYFKLKENSVALSLLISFGIFYFYSQLIPKFLLTRQETFPFLIIFASILYLNKTLNEKILWKKILPAIIILYFIGGAWDGLADHSFGSKVFEKNATGFYIYGLEREVNDSELKEKIQEYGEITDFYRTNWVAYFKLSPSKSFRTFELEKEVRKKFNSQGYLFLSNVHIIKEILTYRITWPEGLPEDYETFFDERILDLDVMELEWNKEKNYAKIVVSGESHFPNAMLSILNEIRAKGFKGKVFVSSNF